MAIPASAKWKEQVLYSFQGGTDGATPVGGVVFDSQGNLYGATQYGGNDNCSPMAACGTVYQLSPQADGSWTETVLYVFKGKAFNDGEYPEGGLIADSVGNLYGTAAYGGTGSCVLVGITGGCGTVFELSPPQQKGGAWTETILYSFRGGNDGYVPWGDLVVDKSGNLYGSTIFGGGQGTNCDPFYQYCGTVFKLSPPKKPGGKWKEKVLHSFAGGSDGANPNGELVLDRKGAVYGTTYSGGNQNCNYEGESGCGTAFELKPPTKKGGVWSEKVLHRFDRTTSDGGNPMAGLVSGADNKLYGTTLNGGPAGGGIVFRLVPPRKKSGSWTETILNAFGNNVFGYDLEAPLIFDSSGNLYGTANTGSGGAAYGNVFRLKPSGRKGQLWSLSILYDFGGIPDGENPVASLTFDKTGNLYSITRYGGTGTACGFTGCGTVFQVRSR
jgi:uncharacterized repeat protein (TIGR03803 family)